MKDKACSLVMKASQQNKEMKSYKGSSALTQSVPQSVPQSIPSTKNSSAASPNWVASSFRWSKYCGALPSLQSLFLPHVVMSASNILFRLQSSLLFTFDSLIKNFVSFIGSFKNYSLRHC